jgi:hypothetical protein
MPSTGGPAVRTPRTAMPRANRRAEQSRAATGRTGLAGPLSSSQSPAASWRCDAMCRKQSIAGIDARLLAAIGEQLERWVEKRLVKDRSPVC